MLGAPLFIPEATGGHGSHQYHPDYVPALPHQLHRHDSSAGHASLSAMHPCWEERDRKLAEVDPSWFQNPVA
jgi:hypothetical protein